MESLDEVSLNTETPATAAISMSDTESESDSSECMGNCALECNPEIESSSEKLESESSSIEDEFNISDSMNLDDSTGLFDESEVACTSNCDVTGHFDPTLYNKPDVVAPLYEGASITLLEAVSQHLDWFTSHPGTSKEALFNVLHMYHNNILPSGNLLPESYEELMKIVSPFLIKPITFHACQNDCILFRNEHSESLVCPKCQAPRFKYGSVPVKKFVYLPVRPCLERLFGTNNLSQMMCAHNSVARQEMYDSGMWKNAFSANEIFSGDLEHGVGLSLCTDGVNPFSHQRVAYSMWPIVMTILNLPRKIRNKFGNILLLGIVPGSGRKEPASLDPYLEVVVDELLQLSCSLMYDQCLGAPLHVKVKLILYTLDYPGVCKVFNVNGANAYKGCMWCDITGESFVFLSIQKCS